MKNVFKAIILLLTFGLRIFGQTPFTLVGVIDDGGAHNNTGVLFFYEPISNTYTVKVSFDTINGWHPHGGVVQADNGKFYGTTEMNGTRQTGTIFEYDWVKDTLIFRHNFDTLSGYLSFYKLAKAPDGKLYGTTFWGGATGNFGVLFEFNPSTGTYTKILDLDSINTGSHPNCALTLSTNGKFYGTTAKGGIYNWGVLFEFDPNTYLFTKKYDFNLPDVFSGWGSNLLEAGNAKLYGTTNQGGFYGKGSIFEFDPSTGVFAKKKSFSGSTNDANGELPGGLGIGTNGKLYGTNSLGGTNFGGVLYEYDFVNDSMIKKFEQFGACTQPLGTQFGSMPTSSPIQGPNGLIYIITEQSACGCSGSIGEFDPITGSYSKKISLSSTLGCDPEFISLLLLDSTLTQIQEYPGTSNIISYPNPSDKVIHLRSTVGLGIINIYNSLGELVLRTNSINREEQIDVNRLSNGVYFIQSNGSYIKFIKQ